MSVITKLLETEMRAGIDAVINGQKERFKGVYISPRMVETYLLACGWQRTVFNTNGWQYDWWLTFEKCGHSFTAFGCGYEGTFEFSKTEE